MNTAILILWLTGGTVGNRANSYGGITTQEISSMEQCQKVLTDIKVSSDDTVGGICILPKGVK